MNTQQVEAPANPNVLLILWSALLMSQAMYAFILYSQFGMKETYRWFSEDPVHTVFYIMAAVVLVVAILLPRKLFAEAAGKQKVAPSIRHLFVPFILRLALAEASCLFGFIIGMQNQNVQFYLPFLAVSIGFYIKNVPTPQNIKNWLTTKRF